METTSFIKSIENIIRENEIRRFETELEFAKDESRKNDLTEILNRYKRKHDDIAESTKKDMQIFCENLKESQYKKEWKLLLVNLKLDKIEQFYANKNDKIEEFEKVKKMLETGKLKTNMVLYDRCKGMITEINLIDESKKKKTKTVEKEE